MKVVDWTGTLTEEFEDCECFYCGLKWKRHCDDNYTGWAMCHENGIGITDVCDECYNNPIHRNRNAHMVLENDHENHPEWIKKIGWKSLWDGNKLKEYDKDDEDSYIQRVQRVREESK